MNSADIVIHSPYSAGVSVLVLDEKADVQVNVDGQKVQPQITSTDFSNVHLLNVSVSPGAGSGAASGDYEYRLSAL